MMSQAGKQIIMMLTLPNISRSKGNQTMKFIEYNMRNIFHEKSYTKCGPGTDLSTFKKIKIEHILVSPV